MINREGSSSSRFHIIKLETGPYKRGRWNCRDFDESTSTSTSTSGGGGGGAGASVGTLGRSDMIVFGPRSTSSSESSGRPSYHIIADENGQMAGGEHPVLLMSSMTGDHHHHHHGPSSLASKPPLPNRHQNSPQQQSSPTPSSLHHWKASSVTTHSVDGSHHAPSSQAQAPAPAAPSSAAPSTTKAGGPITQPPLSISIPAPSSSTSLPNIAQQQQQSRRQRSQSPAPIPSTTTTSTSMNTTSTPSAMATAGRFQVRPVDLNNAAAAILDSIVGSMQNDNHRMSIGNGDIEQESNAADGSVGAGSSNLGSSQGPGGGSVGANVVAIDNKIEQAMDLVKTHLLYAVREEVEVLKEKIIDLEKKVFRLETENKLLREYAPPEILQQIQQPSHIAHHSSSSGTINNDRAL